MMRKLHILAMAAMIIVSGCTTTGIPASPSVVADTTTVDERAALGVEVLYSAWAAVVETALDIGVLKGPTAGRVRELDNRIYLVVRTARRAYDAGNSASYAQSVEEASRMISEGVAMIKGARAQ